MLCGPRCRLGVSPCNKGLSLENNLVTPARTRTRSRCLTLSSFLFLLTLKNHPSFILPSVAGQAPSKRGENFSHSVSDLCVLLCFVFINKAQRSNSNTQSQGDSRGMLLLITRHSSLNPKNKNPRKQAPGILSDHQGGV